MSIGVRIHGFRARPAEGQVMLPADAWLARVAQWLETRLGDRLESAHLEALPGGDALLLLRLHPAIEPARISASATGRVVTEATTSDGGAGYHVFICDLFRELLREHAVSYDPTAADERDESGYLASGSVQAVENEMLAWLADVCVQVRALAARGMTRIGISMPADLTFEVAGALMLTPLGPRDEEWLAAVERSPSRGRDIFPWWKRPDDAPENLLNEALCSMWTDVRWRTPIDANDRALVERVCSLLAQAFAANPALRFPWREWHELRGFLGLQDGLAAEIARRAAAVPDELPRVGYRRGNVVVNLPREWTVRIPGAFAQQWNKNGSFLAHDDSRFVEITSVTVNRPDRSASSVDEIFAKRPLPQPEPIEHRGAHLRGRARIALAGESAREKWLLSGEMAGPGHLAMCAIGFSRDEDRDWAIETWRSLTRPR